MRDSEEDRWLLAYGYDFGLRMAASFSAHMGGGGSSWKYEQWPWTRTGQAAADPAYTTVAGRYSRFGTTNQVYSTPWNSLLRLHRAQPDVGLYDWFSGTKIYAIFPHASGDAKTLHTRVYLYPRVLALLLSFWSSVASFCKMVAIVPREWVFAVVALWFTGKVTIREPESFLPFVVAPLAHWLLDMAARCVEAGVAGFWPSVPVVCLLCKPRGAGKQLATVLPGWNPAADVFDFLENNLNLQRFFREEEGGGGGVSGGSKALPQEGEACSEEGGEALSQEAGPVRGRGRDSRNVRNGGAGREWGTRKDSRNPINGGTGRERTPQGRMRF
eukprot:CAMPEP_0178991496 /NCGR_PEP_ID=MMETSP0795-20121207/5561_1 /TAXON_ID=88552 /ORGANISM="Amoebophrya sp., Strain Ameob2" /LENGTH=328 /DNA_ID=CAMNT_0020683213 /DNA_START=576 /DNA_END=1562 /DNA_ORIENTATION=+